jgi:exonuclease SbcC
MRPAVLTIEGLTSFREQQTIDFSELELFVITGPTGAGKSSILDAITFALYGDIARVNGHELRDLISHGLSDMRVSLDFFVGGSHFRVARRLGRKASQVASLERIDNGSTTPELERGGVRVVNKRLEEILGLDFEAFTKAVLLPQGEFQEFLRGDVGQRRRILMRLLDLGRYERAGQAARREATRLEAILAEREALIESNYQDATAERLADLKAAVKVALERQKKVEQAKKDAKRIADAAGDAERRIKALDGSKSQLEGVVASLEELSESWPDLEAENAVADEGAAKAALAVAEADKALAGVAKALTKTIERTGDATLLTRLEGAATTFSSGQDEVARLDGEIARAKERATSCASLRDAAEMLEKSAKAQFAEIAKALSDAEAKLRLADAIARCASCIERVSELQRKRDAAAEKRDALVAPREQAEERAHHLEREHAAVALRVDLTPGDTCPVCQAIIETLPPAVKNVEALIAQARDALSKAQTAEHKASTEVVTLEAKLAIATDELNAARQELPKKTEIQTVAEAEGLLAEAKNNLADIQLAAASAHDAVDKAVLAVGETKTSAASADERLEGLTKARGGAQERRQAALSTLTAALGEKLPPDVAAEITRRREELADAEKAHEEAVAVVDAARRAQTGAMGSQAKARERMSAFDADLAGLEGAARVACEAIALEVGDKKLPVVPAEGLDRARGIRAWHERSAKHVEIAGRGIARLRAEIQEVAEKLRSLAEKAELALTATQPAAIAAEIDEASVTAHGSVVAAEKDVEALLELIRKRRELEQAIADDRRLRALYAALARDLQTDHFIAFVLEASMIQLADQASIELEQISDRRYSLVADGGSFEVVDHHNADERRSVATLSGGETFLASLSLALALSTGLRELASVAAERLDAIFIDEGFGALDPETLDVVVEALQRLRDGNRMVGVITHVPALAEQIPEGLVVEATGSASRIRTRS